MRHLLNAALGLWRATVCATASSQSGSAELDAALDAASGSDLPAAPRAFHSNASARSAFQEASKLARSEGSSRLLGAHVVAAVAQMEHGTPSRALSEMGIDRAALAAAAHEEISAHHG